ncbi:MAG: aminotransferase class III-fold pyridoxal phosphate-dependent enzyme, partial [Actinomycetota bacterium]
VYQGGTLSGNPVAMAAGIATLQALAPGHSDVADPYVTLETMGARLQEGLVHAAKKTGLPVTVQRVGSMLTVFFTDEEVTNFEKAKRCDTKAFARFFHALLDEGVYWPPSQFECAFLSTAHSEGVVDAVVSAAGKAFEKV